jgi:glycosyltransferase involved in cell wall biosynthesis
VIASNLPGVRAVVVEGEDGYLVEPGDVGDLATKINYMLALPEGKRQAMGTAGKRKVEREYSWELAGQRLEGIYQMLVAQHNLKKELCL